MIAPKKITTLFPSLMTFWTKLLVMNCIALGMVIGVTTKSNMGWRLWKRQRQLKHLKIKGIALKRPDFNGTKMVLNWLYVDVSNIVVATLSRLADKGQDHPICYVSRQFIPIEQNYIVTE